MPATESTRDNDARTSHLRGSVLLASGRVLAILVNFTVQVLTVRYLPKADYGIFAFALSVAAMVAVLSAFGMDKAASRFLSVYLEQRDVRRFWGMLILMFGTVLGLGTLAVVVFVSAWTAGLPLMSGDARTQAVLAIFAGVALCNALDSLFISLFAVLASPAAIFVRRYLLAPILKLAAAVAVIAAGGNIYAFAAGQLVAAAVGIAICVPILYRLVLRQRALRGTSSDSPILPFRQLYSYSATLLSGDLAFLFRGALVPVVLGILFAASEVAIFSAVLPFARLNEFVLLTFSVLFLPNAAKLAAADRDAALQKLFEKTTVWVTLLSFPVFAALFLASSFLPVLLFGQEYRPSGSILAWLSLGYFANASFGTNLRLLRAVGALRTLLAADVILMAVALILVGMLVPRYGAQGGAWAVCGVYLSQAVIYQVLVATTTSVNPFARTCVLPFLIGLAMCLAGDYLLQSVSGGPVLAACVAVLASFAVLVLFGGELDLPGTFPEITRLPIVRRWTRPAGAGEAGMP